MKAVRITRTGGPEVLEIVDAPVPVAGPGEILVRHEAIGLNFIDTYQRSGLYPVQLPAFMGLEAAGVVEAIGEGVSRFAVGDRAAYNAQPGAYADFNAVKADKAVKLPDHIPSKLAAAIMLKGMTAEVLANRIWPLQAGDAVLLHAAAGGVGTLLSQWLRHLGVRVIGVVSTPAKAALAKAHGCTEVLLTSDDIAARARELTDGQGVKVVYDSVGKVTFEASLASLAKRGLFVSFGNASGPVEPFAPSRLQRAGSLFLTRPTLFDYTATTEELDLSSGALFEVIRIGAVKVEIGAERPLSEIRQAHEALEARQTTGATILIP